MKLLYLYTCHFINQFTFPKPEAAGKNLRYSFPGITLTAAEPDDFMKKKKKKRYAQKLKINSSYRLNRYCGETVGLFLLKYHVC